MGELPHWKDESDLADCGVVFGACGENYVALARQAARTVRETNPGLQIDLFTDKPIDTDPFDQVHLIEESWFRPKFDAILGSRFQRTMCLDVDLIVVADVTDVFWLLKHFEFAASQIESRNGELAITPLSRVLPNAFPQINSGVIGVRKSERTDAFFRKVKARMIEENLPKDQPCFREELLTSDLRIATLPPEYNFRSKRNLAQQTWRTPAPRILHHGKFNRKTRKLNRAATPKEVYGDFLLQHIADLIRADNQLSDPPTANTPAALSILPTLWNMAFKKHRIGAEKPEPRP